VLTCSLASYYRSREGGPIYVGGGPLSLARLSAIPRATRLNCSVLCSCLRILNLGICARREFLSRISVRDAVASTGYDKTPLISKRLCASLLGKYQPVNRELH